MNRAALQLHTWIKNRGRHARAEISRAIDTTPAALQHWERGRAVPSLRNAIGLRDFCGIALESWLEPVDPTSTPKVDPRQLSLV